MIQRLPVKPFKIGPSTRSVAHFVAISNRLTFFALNNTGFFGLIYLLSVDCARLGVLSLFLPKMKVTKMASCGFLRNKPHLARWGLLRLATHGGDYVPCSFAQAGLGAPGILRASVQGAPA